MAKKLWKNVVCVGVVCLVAVWTVLVPPSVDVEVIGYDDEVVITPFDEDAPVRPKG